MALGLGKLRVLETKLDIYEDLSKEMLDKLERAVSTISENNNRVAIILERHENRIEEGERINGAIMKLIEKVDEKVDNLESKINQLQKFRWMTVGVAITAVTILKAPDIFSSFLTPQPNVSMIERTHIHRLG